MAGSKAVRRGRTVGRAARTVAHPTARIVTSCNGGRQAYVFNPSTLLTGHFDTAGRAFIDSLADVVAAGFGKELRQELDTIRPHERWARTVEKLEQAGVLAASSA